MTATLTLAAKRLCFWCHTKQRSIYTQDLLSPERKEPTEIASQVHTRKETLSGAWPWPATMPRICLLVAAFFWHQGGFDSIRFGFKDVRIVDHRLPSNLWVISIALSSFKLHLTLLKETATVENFANTSIPCFSIARNCGQEDDWPHPCQIQRHTCE